MDQSMIIIAATVIVASVAALTNVRDERATRLAKESRIATLEYRVEQLEKGVSRDR